MPTDGSLLPFPAGDDDDDGVTGGAPIGVGAVLSVPGFANRELGPASTPVLLASRSDSELSRENAPIKRSAAVSWRSASSVSALRAAGIMPRWMCAMAPTSNAISRRRRSRSAKPGARSGRFVRARSLSYGQAVSMEYKSWSASGRSAGAPESCSKRPPHHGQRRTASPATTLPQFVHLFTVPPQSKQVVLEMLV